MQAGDLHQLGCLLNIEDAMRQTKLNGQLVVRFLGVVAFVKHTQHVQLEYMNK